MGRTQHVLLTLLVNATEVMIPLTDVARVLVLASTREGSQLRPAAQDFGIGLQPDGLERIFDAFFTTRPRGTEMDYRLL